MNHSRDGKSALCPSCGASRRFTRVGNRPAFRCTSCGRYVHPTAGTIFHRSSTPLHVWFRAMQLLIEGGGEVSAKDLERELGVTYKTAWRMRQLIHGRLVRSGIELVARRFDPDAVVAALARPDADVPILRRSARRRPVWGPGIISTFAGDGTAAYGGDGGPAAAAQLNEPLDVTVDGRGDVFVADFGNHAIRRVDAAGVITTVAGCGRPGYSGDGGLATDARLNGPTGVAVDEAGNLFIADNENHVVRRVDRDGVIVTVAGTGEAGFSGDGGPATEARLNWVGRMLVVGGLLFISDYRNNRVRVVDDDNRITTFAGTGSDRSSGDGGPAEAAGIVRPSGLALDVDGSLLLAQPGDPNWWLGRVRRISGDGTIFTIAGGELNATGGDGGPAILAGLGNPTDVAVDAGGGVLISDLRNNRVRRVDRAGSITTVVGAGLSAFGGNGGPAELAFLNRPMALAICRDGGLLIADSWNNRIRKVAGPLPWSADDAPGFRTSAG